MIGQQFEVAFAVELMGGDATEPESAVFCLFHCPLVQEFVQVDLRKVVMPSQGRFAHEAEELALKALKRAWQAP